MSLTAHYVLFFVSVYIDFFSNKIKISNVSWTPHCLVLCRFIFDFFYFWNISKLFLKNDNNIQFSLTPLYVKFFAGKTDCFYFLNLHWFLLKNVSWTLLNDLVLCQFIWKKFATFETSQIVLNKITNIQFSFMSSSLPVYFGKTI